MSRLIPPTINPASDTTGSTWSDPSRWTPTARGPIAPGCIIKNRFILESVIGRGRMGMLFRARDLRKVEAQDRDPYVAIRILDDDFKRRPQALRALQREARQAQSLAHPNIATVYDFDRDGTDVYMVMELLEGESLDRVLKRVEGVGLGVKEALRITRDICEAMAYAHQQDITHGNFKPANVFLMRQGGVKVLDFGIVWPVLEETQSDVREDIYAVACVTYELLTGRHPFNGLSADDARRANLFARQPAQLTRRQWLTLKRALAFRRDERHASVMQFLQGMLPKRRSPARYVAAAAVLAAVIAGSLFYTHAVMYRDRALIGELASAQGSQVEALLPKLRALAPKDRAAILLNDGARSALTEYFKQRIDNAVDPDNDRYDYLQAAALLAELQRLVPDSQAVSAIADGLNRRRDEAIQRQVAAAIGAQDQITNDTDAQVAMSPSTNSAASLEANSGLAETQPPKMMAAASFVEAPARQQDIRDVESEPIAEASPASELNDDGAMITAAASSISQSVTKIEPLALAPDLDPVAQVASLKKRLLDQTQANEIKESLATLQTLRTVLPANDPFVTKTAPQAIGDVYLRAASMAAKEGRLQDALKLAEAGNQMAPEIQTLAAARDRYARYLEIDNQLQQDESLGRLTVHHIRWKLSRLRKQAPDEVDGVTQRLASDLAGRINSTQDADLAIHLSRAARAIFAGSPLFEEPMEQVAADESGR